MNDRRSLLVLTQTHNHWGGIESWMAEVLPYLEECGWKVDYGLALGPVHNCPVSFLSSHPYMRRTHVLDGRAMTPSSRRRAVQRIVRQLQPDLVMPIAIGDALPALIDERTRGSRTRMLVPIHSLHSETLADVAAFAAHIDMVAGVSGLFHRWAVDLPDLGPQRVRWVRNGAPPAITTRRPAVDALLRVGYVGRLESELHKRALDVPAIVRTAAQAGAALSLLLAGEGPSRQALEEQLQTGSGLRGFRSLGLRTRQDLYREVYPNLDVLLLTSNTEGSPLVVIESMQNGVVPVVSEFFGYASEGLLRPEENCLVFPVADTAKAAAQLNRLAGDPALLRRLSSAARQSVSTEYTSQSMCRRWAAVADEVLAAPPRPSAGRQVHVPAVHGRLDRLGLPAGAVDWIRRRMPKPPTSSGFDEWPGSVSDARGVIGGIDSRLWSIEQSCRQGVNGRACVET